MLPGKLIAIITLIVAAGVILMINFVFCLSKKIYVMNSEINSLTKYINIYQNQMKSLKFDALRNKQRLHAYSSVFHEKLKDVNEKLAEKLKEEASTDPPPPITTTTMQNRQLLIKKRKLMIQKRKKWSPIMTNQDQKLMIKLLKVFSEVASRNNYPYFMWGGTLLGSYRHHGIVPWDDDVDVLLNATARPSIDKDFKHLEPDYVLRYTDNRYKFFHKDSLPLNGYSWKWPYVDITLFHDNGTHVTEAASAYGVTVSVPRKAIVPFKKRPFMNLWVNAPNDAFATLVWSYGFTSKCRMIGYSHMMEGADKSGTIECSKLASRYAFVRRSIDKKGRMKEELLLKNKLIHTLYTNEPVYALSEPYALRMQSGAKLRSDIKWPDKNTKVI